MSKFTSEQIDEMVGTYVASAEENYVTRTVVVKELADKFKVTENSIRGILVANEVYVKKEVKAAVTKGADKEATIKAFEASFGLKMPSMRNMNKKDVVAFWEKVKEASNIKEVE